MGDRLIARVDNGSQIYYYHLDRLGTPQGMSNQTGAVVWRADYEPFGKAVVKANTVENNIRFPGQYFDKETGLHYNYFRDYDPTTGRYIEADPIGLDGGMNLYAYVGGNPISYTDSTGLLGFGLTEFISSAIGADIDFAKNYFDMRQANTIGADKYFHCKANCEAASRGVGGVFEASILSEFRELMDEYIKRDSSEACNADRRANNHGRQGGANNPSGLSCQQICSPFHPSGLAPNY